MSNKQRLKKYNYKAIILKTIAASAVLTVAMVAPNALKMFDMFGKSGLPHRKMYLKSKLSSLIDQGYVSVKPSTNGKKYLSLTDKGKLEFSKFLKTPFKRPAKWQGTWSVVIFDVPESKKRIRDIVRFHLKRIGFLQLQKSVWVFPYRCEEIVTIIKTNFKMGKEVVYMEVKKIENDRALREHFQV